MFQWNYYPREQRCHKPFGSVPDTIEPGELCYVGGECVYIDEPTSDEAMQIEGMFIKQEDEEPSEQHTQSIVDEQEAMQTYYSELLNKKEQ